MPVVTFTLCQTQRESRGVFPPAVCHTAPLLLVVPSVTRPRLLLVRMKRAISRAPGLVAWLSGRAWSRAGAVADVALTHRTRRVLAVTTQVAIFLTGATVLASSVAVLLWNDLGPGPLDVFVGAIRQLAGVPLAIALWATVGSMMVVATLLGRRPGPGTIVGPLIIGPTMQAVLAVLERFEHPAHVVVQLPVHLVAIAGVGLGAGAMVVSGIGSGTGELLAAAASDKSGHPQPRVRLVIESLWLIVGAALGGPVGFGTVLVALLIGPAVAAGYRAADATLGATLAAQRRHPRFAHA